MKVSKQVASKNAQKSSKNPKCSKILGKLKRLTSFPFYTTALCFAISATYCNLLIENVVQQKKQMKITVVCRVAEFE